MKILVKNCFLLVITFFIQTAFAQSPLEINPRYPERGQEVTITYHAGGPGAKIPADAKAISLVFTYSTFYELPYDLPLKKDGNDWSATFKLQRYATFATFYVKSGSLTDKPTDNKQFAIAVYKDGQRVRDGYLHEAYSLSAQMGRSPLIHDMQRELLKQELKAHPDNYEAQVRLITNSITGTKNPEEKKILYAEAHRVIADRFAKAPTTMGVLNTVTMGYLIIGEKSRVDSVHRVVIGKYPASDAALDFLTEEVTNEKDTTKRILRLEQALKIAKDPKGDGATSVHKDLFDYYAARKNTQKALYNARFFRNDASPHRAATLKEIAETLTDNHLAPDTALKYARQAMAIADTYPVGIIRYFPEYGYIPGYVADSVRAKRILVVKGNLLATMAANYMAKNNKAQALTNAGQAVALAQDKQTLNNAASVYEHFQQAENAYNNYWKILQQDPGNTAARVAAKRNYIAFKGSEHGYAELIGELDKVLKQQMMGSVKKERLNLPGAALTAIADLQGKPLDKELLKDKIVIMDFWATWCVPCMEELPYLQKVYDAYKNNPKVMFMVVNSGSKNTLADAQNWAKQHRNYTFPLYYNGDPDIGDKVGFSLIPTIAVLDASGKMQFRTIGFEGEILERKLSAEIDVLLDSL